MSALVRLVLGIFGIREVTKEDGLIDRAIDSPFARVGYGICLLYTSPSPRDGLLSRMPSSA